MNLLAEFENKFPNIVNALYNATKSNRLAHAYLLHGDDDVVKHKFSLALSQLATCDYRENGKACGKCTSCRQIAEDNYAELYHLTPVGKTRQIRVGDAVNPEPNTVRWFEDLFYLTNIAGSKKIGIITDAERMNKQAQNAFLKTLEEPPADSLFILTTSNSSMLLPTTISRCQQLMILSNKCRYNFEGAADLFKSLHQLYFSGSKSIIAAEDTSQTIIAIANSLKQQADSAINQALEAELEKYDDSQRKSITERFENQKHAAYLNMRISFLDAIHTFFAQLHYLALGCNPKLLANREIMECLQSSNFEEIGDSKSFNCMNEATKLIDVLKWQVTESLAFRAFCMNIAFKC